MTNGEPLYLFNFPQYNHDMIIKTVDDYFTPSNQIRILEFQCLFKKILSNFIITSTEDPPVLPGITTDQWKSQLMMHLNTHCIVLNQNALTTVKDMLDSTNQVQMIHKKIRHCQANFYTLLTNQLAPHQMSHSDSNQHFSWNTMITWIEKHFRISNAQIPNQIIYLITKGWVDDIKKDTIVQLNHHIKNHLHSQVTQRIILPKIRSKNGWKHQLLNQKKSRELFIQTIKKRIESDIQHITQPIDAPFIERFKDELIARCITHFTAPHEPQTKKNTITTTSTVFQTKPKQLPLPPHIQIMVETEMYEFLTFITEHPPNATEYPRKRINHFKKIINHPDVTVDHRKEIQRFYHRIYRATKHYQKLISERKRQSMTAASPADIIKCICLNIEMITHEFKPFLYERVCILQSKVQCGPSSLKKKWIQMHQLAIRQLLHATESLKYARLLNQYFAFTRPSEKLPNWVNSNTLKHSLQPWQPNQWPSYLNSILKSVGLTPAESYQPKPLITKSSPASIQTVIQDFPEQKKPPLNHQI
jgi:hypothetical protein